MSRKRSDQDESRPRICRRSSGGSVSKGSIAKCDIKKTYHYAKRFFERRCSFSAYIYWLRHEEVVMVRSGKGRPDCRHWQIDSGERTLGQVKQMTWGKEGALRTLRRVPYRHLRRHGSSSGGRWNGYVGSCGRHSHQKYIVRSGDVTEEPADSWGAANLIR